MTRLLLLSVFLASPAAADVPRVVTDILPVHGLVSRVMEGLGEPALILPPNASPHGYAMRPSEAAALQDADVVVWIGPALTPWMESALGSLAADVTQVTLLEVDGTVLHLFGEEHGDHDDHEDGAHEDHAAHGDHADHDDHAGDEDHDDHDDHADHTAGDGHDHGDGVDPHAWLDPVNGALWLASVAEALAAADPDNAARYRANAAQGQAEIAATSAEIAALLAPVHDQRFMTFHDAYGYFEERFGLASSGAVRLGDATAPGAAHVSRLQDIVAAEGITCLFSEPQFDPSLAETVLEGSGAKIATLDPIGMTQTPGATFYPNFLKTLANDMTECLIR